MKRKTPFTPLITPTIDAHARILRMLVRSALAQNRWNVGMVLAIVGAYLGVALVWWLG